MRAKTWKALIVAALAVVILTAAVGGTMAWLSTNTNALTNTFEPAKVTCAVEEETFDGKTKENVKIKNTGTTDAYIRAMIVANWCTAADENGKTKVVAPYEVNAENFIGLAGDNWKPYKGFYYYTQPVAPNGGTTNYLFTSCTPGNDKPEGADHLEVNIICQAVQSTPTAAVVDAWGVDPSTLQ